jgi:hypothetical protein
MVFGYTPVSIYTTTLHFSGIQKTQDETLYFAKYTFPYLLVHWGQLRMLIYTTSTGREDIIHI